MLIISYYFISLDFAKKYTGIAIIANITAFNRNIVKDQAKKKKKLIILNAIKATIIAIIIDNVFFMENKFI
ncbi:MAG: hypothetical protein NTW25_13225 [Candidatus Kapabacteria bacterium]|nr:hypothetical protein [Candidatus Kapabacteria bacterium]